MNPFVLETLHVALSRVGVSEHPLGSNRGPEVETYLRSVGLLGGNPWCAAKVFNDGDTAASRLGVVNPLPRTGACVVFERWARTKKILRDAPQKGDLVLFYGSPEGYRRACHIGEVWAVEPDGQWFWTVEGNTNTDGSREGTGVYKKRRPLDPKRCAFIRIDDLPVVPTLTLPAAPPLKHSVQGQVRVLLNGKFIGVADRLDGRSWFCLNTFYGALGQTWKWNTEHQVVIVDDQEKPLDTRQFGGPVAFTTVAPIRQLAKFSGLTVVFDEAKREVRLSRLRLV